MEATLREKATEAWEIESDRREQADADNAQELYNAAAELFFDTFGTAPDGGAITPDTDSVILERGELRLVATPTENTDFRLLGECPNCGDVSVSRPFQAIEGLGKMLDTFVPSIHHRCPKAAEEPTNSESLTKALMGNTLDYAHSAKAILADALSALSIIEGNHRKAKKAVADCVAAVDKRATDLTRSLWPTIDGTDPQTGRKNKGWAESQLREMIDADDMMQAMQTCLMNSEAAEAAMLPELDRAKLAVKLADLEWRYAMAEIKARTALLTFSEGL